MKLIKNLSIRNKLILISIIPFIVMLYYLVSSLSEEVENSQQVSEVLEDVIEIKGISNVVHELQLERGLVFCYLSNPGSFDQRDVLSQQQVVNKTIIEAEQLAGTDFSFGGSSALLGELNDIREEVSPGTDPEAPFYTYGEIIEEFIDEIEEISARTANPEIKELLQSHVFLLYAREFLGQMRSRLFDNIRNEAFRDYKVTEFGMLVGKYQINIDRFKNSAPEKLEMHYSESLSNPLLAKALQIIDSVLYDPAFSDFPYNAEEWWTASTAYIDILKGISNRSEDHILAEGEARLSRIRKSIITNVILGLGIILIIIALIIYVTKLISTSVSEIRNAAESITKGETDYVLNINSNDEIGILAKSFTGLIHKTKSFAEVAEKIGRGDYLSEVPVRSDKDTLGVALNSMRANLMKLSEENESRNWYLKGNSELNDRMRGEKGPNELANAIINHVCAYVDAQIGAIYLVNGEELTLEGSYAFHYRKHNKNKIVMGEGLVGQSALEKKVIVFTEVPDDYIRINSGLGEARPRNIVVLPLVQDEKVKGVLEVGSIHEFTDQQLEFLKSAAENIAISIGSAQNRQTLEESLDQIQLQKTEMERISYELTQQVDCLNNAAIVSTTDAEGKIMYVNDLFCEISKYRREELIGKNHRILKSDKQPDGLFVGMWKAISMGRIWRGEILNKAKDGSFYWVDTTITPFKGVGGKIEKYVAVRFDITEQKQQAEELKNLLKEAQEQKTEMERISYELTQQVDCLNNAAIVSATDAEGKITYVNDLFCEISKYSREELVGKNHRILKSGKQPDGLFVGMWKAISMGRIWHGEILNKAKDGSFYWVDTTITPFKGVDGKIEKYVAVRFDITRQKEQAEELKELLEETQRQAEELEAQQEELRQSNEELEEKTDLLEKSESELKAQQEELQQTNEELEEKANLLEEQKQNLEEAKLDVETKARELEITSKYKSEFLANMSHELRTPLNSILILAQLLSENKTQVLGEKEIEFANNIYNSGTDLLNLINEILDLSKVEAGKIELEIEELDLTDMTSHLKHLFDEMAKSKSITYSFDLNDKKLKRPIKTDKLRLEQIIRNLLSNAFKFTEKGGKIHTVFRVAKPDKTIMNEKLRKQKELLAISVQDDGIGIPEEKQSMIFEAFQQADGSTKRKYGGTGLGLSISRELTSALGGEIHLESAEGVGSTFTIYLPLAFDRSLVQEFEKKVSVGRHSDKTDKKLLVSPDLVRSEPVDDDRYTIKEDDKLVLIIEDDTSFSRLLLNFVKERGYKGIVAQQGNTGLSLARYYHPHAIILDMKLPVMDGAEILKHLKSDPDLRHIPVQIVSGYDTRKEGLELGAFNFIKKPIDNKVLQKAFDRIEEFISKKLKKLLVIEDNKQQNQAIKELVGNGDIKSYSAYTANQAIKMINKEEFDCLIIDLGLPDMNGFELLENIRNQHPQSQTPIIVYTGKELEKKEVQRLEKLANTVVLKTADSVERLLDETTLFLHRVEAHLPKEKQNIIRKLHRTDEVLKNKKVLVVDDDMRNIFSLTNVLENEGMICLTAENGREAISMLKKNHDIDIVLMDVMMPEMDGLEATAEVRKMNKFIKLPIIALTAKAMKGDREECLKAGMSDYISKPVDVDKLLSLMRVWLYS